MFSLLQNHLDLESNWIKHLQSNVDSSFSYIPNELNFRGHFELSLGASLSSEPSAVTSFWSSSEMTLSPLITNNLNHNENSLLLGLINSFNLNISWEMNLQFHKREKIILIINISAYQHDTEPSLSGCNWPALQYTCAWTFQSHLPRAV